MSNRRKWESHRSVSFWQKTGDGDTGRKSKGRDFLQFVQREAMVVIVESPKMIIWCDFAKKEAMVALVEDPKMIIWCHFAKKKRWWQLSKVQKSSPQGEGGWLAGWLAGWWLLLWPSSSVLKTTIFSYGRASPY